MKTAFVLFALAFATIGYSQKEKDIKLNKETNLFEATYYHDNGEVSQEGTFDMNGKLHGEWTSYDNSGAKVSEGSYKNGARTGTWFFWSENVVKEVEFDNNLIANVINRESDSGVVTKN